MKILYLLNSDFGGNQIGGRPRHIIDQLSKKDDITIYCRGYDKSLKNKYNIIQVMPQGKLIMQALTAIPIYVSKRLSTNAIKILLFETFLLNKLKKINLEEYDLIHSTDFLPNVYDYIKKQNSKIKIFQDVPIALPNVLHKIKDVDILWKGENLEIKNYIKNSFKYVDYFIAPSEFVKGSLTKEKISPKKIKVVPFGVNSDNFKPISKKPSNFNIALSGNINFRKGVLYLLQAWKKLKDENLIDKKAKLNLYGRIYPEIKPLIKDSNKYNVITHGYIDLRKELPKNNLFVFPSLMEGSAKAVYEALSCAIPVITTYNAGSVIEDSKEGFIIPIQDVDAICEKILYFYNNEAELKKFSRNARLKAKKYPWSRYGKELIKLYKQ